MMIDCNAFGERQCLIKARSIHTHAVFMLEIYCETGVVFEPNVGTYHGVRRTRVYSGDLRATFTLPFLVDIVEVYRETTSHGMMASFGPNEMLIEMTTNYDLRRAPWNRVARFRIFLPESLQSLALAAFIESEDVVDTVQMHALEWLRDV